ncbi:MAG: helix-turn-helix domain-containing protein [Yoonia sp.]|nr:helix-turn-helix domain-containing protein [Yoonia sp.]
MHLATEQQATALNLTLIAQNPGAGRWRTEAMRSHATPRLIYITKGQGRITVAGLTSGYGPNNLIYVPAHTMYGFEVGPTVFGQLLTIPAAMANEWPAKTIHLRLRDVMAQKEFAHMVEALERELKSAGRTHSRAAHYHLGLLAVFFDRQLDHMAVDTHTARTKTSAARLVAAFTDLIERDYRKYLGVSDYATALGVTPTHLTRCCNQTCGKSALALLRDRVNYEACVLLCETRTPVNEIAAQLGFASAAYFARSFAAQTGTTPSDFRKRGAATQQNGSLS